MTTTPSFLTSAQVARYAQVDRRTFEHRAARAGLERDAALIEPVGDVSLWRAERLPALLEACASTRSLPIPLAALLGLSPSPTQ